MYYHVSKTAGITVLKPHVSTHKKAYVYATENMVTGLLFGAPHDDFDFIINVEDDIPVIRECYPDAFRTVFCGRACSVYEVYEDGFKKGMTSWDSELVCEHEVPVVHETAIDDLYSRLLDEESDGTLKICRYEDTAEYKKRVSEHIVDRLIRFDAVYSENERLKKHYGRIMNELRSIMDGHLL